MRFLSFCALLSIVLLPALKAMAQDGHDGFRRGDKGRYEFYHTAYAPGVTKALLYERMKPFIIEDLNASDTRIAWDDAGQDSVATIAYLELGDGPEIMNQLVDCKARLDFKEGEVSLQLSGFNYTGKHVDSNISYARPLNRLRPVPNSAQSYAMTVLTETLRQLMEKMDRVAVGRR